MSTAPSELLNFAESALANGQHWRADSAARLLIQSFGPNPAASAIREHVAALMGLTDWRERPAAPDAGKYLMIQACGAGFWSDMAHVIAGLLLAEITGRTPVVHWGANCRFRAPDLGAADAFGQFFDPIAPASIELLETVGDRWPRDWPLTPPASGATPPPGCSPLDLLARREALVIAPRYLPLPDLADWIPRRHRLFGLSPSRLFRTLMAEHLRIRPEILAAAKAVQAGPLHGGPYVSIHVRGTDKKNEVPNNDALITAYLLWSDRMMRDNDLPLFIATDDARFAEIFRDRFGSRAVLTEATRRSDSIGVHSQPGDQGRSLGIELLIDCLVAAGGERFAGNGLSGPSCAIALMRDQPEETCTLFAESLWLREDMALLLL